MSYKLTKNGKQLIKLYIDGMKAKRKEILDAGLDTCDETNIPTQKDILSDLDGFIDESGYYYNCWGVTDNYNYDVLISLKFGVDFVNK